jgi:DNA-binding response OmpR family regulator
MRRNFFMWFGKRLAQSKKSTPHVFAFMLKPMLLQLHFLFRKRAGSGRIHQNISRMFTKQVRSLTIFYLIAWPMKILVVEDEAHVVSVIRRSLSEAGYEVSVAMDGNSGYQMAKTNPFDLLILDIMMPGMNGLELCRKLRSEDLRMPILMLTALNTTENIVSGLDSGADDYLAKPFSFNELLARIRSLLRRNTGDGPGSSRTFSIGALHLDPDAKRVEYEGEPILLTATEFRLLEYFLRNKNKVLSRVDILEAVWGIDFNMSTNVVDVYINYLRKKLDKAGAEKLIHTQVGMGYILKD